MRQAFDQGAKEEFFRAWKALTEPAGELMANNFSAKKLEFNLRIYFVIFIHHPHNSAQKRQKSEKELKKEQNDFKLYLDTKGAELSRTSEFLAFYALPYIQNPKEHPSFAHLYTMDWVNQLKQKLKVFIHDHAIDLGLPHMAQQSQLY